MHNYLFRSRTTVACLVPALSLINYYNTIMVEQESQIRFVIDACEGSSGEGAPIFTTGECHHLSRGDTFRLSAVIPVIPTRIVVRADFRENYNNLTR